jgi:hypothetical protein
MSELTRASPCVTRQRRPTKRQAEVILSLQAFILHLSRNLFTGSPETLSQVAANVATIANTT